VRAGPGHSKSSASRDPGDRPRRLPDARCTEIGNRVSATYPPQPGLRPTACSHTEVGNETLATALQKGGAGRRATLLRARVRDGLSASLERAHRAGSANFGDI